MHEALWIVIVVAVGVTCLVTPILLIHEYLQDERQNAIKPLDCAELLKEIQDTRVVKYDFAVREWIGDECWKK